jgi:hypothetical protein
MFLECRIAAAMQSEVKCQTAGAVAQASCLWGHRASRPVSGPVHLVSPGETPGGPTAETAVLRIQPLHIIRDARFERKFRLVA